MLATTPKLVHLSRHVIKRTFASPGAQQSQQIDHALIMSAPTTPSNPSKTKRQREGWELMWYFGMFGGMAAAALGLYYKPDTSIQTWALQEAKSRMDARGEKYKYEPQTQ